MVRQFIFNNKCYFFIYKKMQIVPSWNVQQIFPSCKKGLCHTLVPTPRTDEEHHYGYHIHDNLSHCYYWACCQGDRAAHYGMQTEIEILYWKQHDRFLVLHKKDLCRPGDNGVLYWFQISGSFTHRVGGKSKECCLDSEPLPWWGHTLVEHKTLVYLWTIKQEDPRRRCEIVSKQTKG